jgi:hypothetical protein
MGESAGMNIHHPDAISLPAHPQLSWRRLALSDRAKTRTEGMASICLAQANGDEGGPQ